MPPHDYFSIDAFPESGLAPPPAARGDYYRWLFLAAGPLESAIALNDLGVAPTPEQAMRLGCGDYWTLAGIAGSEYALLKGQEARYRPAMEAQVNGALSPDGAGNEGGHALAPPRWGQALRRSQLTVGLKGSRLPLGLLRNQTCWS